MYGCVKPYRQPASNIWWHHTIKLTQDRNKENIVHYSITITVFHKMD